MNEIKTIERDRKGNDYFGLIRSRRSNLYLKDLLTLFNIDDYYILKATSNQRIVSNKDFLDLIYGGYLLLNKNLYNLEHIDNWVEYIKNNSIGGQAYLSKPFPPFPPNKIIIK